MAIAKVKGTVSRTFYNGLGAEVVESWQTLDGQTFSKRWACWFEAPHNLVEGAAVEVSGMHSDQVDEWDKDGVTQHTVKRALNKTRIESHGPSGGQHWAQGAQGEQPSQQPAQQPQAGWATPGAQPPARYSDEQPF